MVRNVRSLAPLAVATAASATLITVLATGLPPETFSTGDSGLKLIAALNALAHPSQPFEATLPSIDGRPVPWVGHMMQVHGDHGHVLQGAVFPVMSAPFVALVGLRGAYVLPALAFVAMLPLAFAVTRTEVPAPPLWAVVASAVLASPVFFYALEFWDHVPAAAALGAATALVCRESRGVHPDRRAALAGRRAALAGLAAGLATLLRPEALWFGAALAVVCLRGRRTVVFALAAAVPLGAFAAASYLENGTLLGPHAANALAPLLRDWGSTRLHRAAIWFFPGSAWLVAGAVLIAISWALRFARSDVRLAQAVGLIGAVLVAGMGANGAAGDDALWRAWPVGLIVLVPGLERDAQYRRLLAVVALTTVAVWLTSAHDGGAQWGPRFVLISAPALVALAAMAFAEAAGRGAVRSLRVALVVALIALGGWSSRAAYLELRGTKEVYATLVRAVAAAVPEGGYVITNAWWLDQVSASLHGTRTFLITPSPEAATAALAALQGAHIDTVVLAWSADSGEPGPLDSALAGTCWTPQRRTETPERAMTLLSASCRR